VCDRWQDFAAFWEDMGPTYKSGLTLERIDNNGNYEPKNCTWVTRKQQAYNRRSNRYIDTPWGRMTITEASVRSGVSVMTLHGRIKRNGVQARMFDPTHLAPTQWEGK